MASSMLSASSFATRCPTFLLFRDVLRLRTLAMTFTLAVPPRGTRLIVPAFARSRIRLRLALLPSSRVPVFSRRTGPLEPNPVR
jgi:hypothetical protein